MQKRKLGANGPEVSAIGLGTWSFSGSYGPTDEAESRDTLHTCIDLGIDFLDTAKAYGAGLAEEVIGRFTKDNPGKFVVATKGGLHRNPETGERWFRNDADFLREELEASLRRLGVDHVPLYYVHKREESRDIEEVMAAMLRFQEEGKIGGIGFCEIAPSSLRVAHAMGPVSAVQSEYSLWSRYPDLGIIQTCADLGVAFVPFSPLGRGILAEKTPDPATFGKIDFRRGSPRFTEPNFSRNVAQVKKFKHLAAGMGTTSPTLAIAWCLARGEHLLPIPGTRSSAHLRECAAAADLHLNEEVLARIEEVLPVGWAHGDRYTRPQWIGAEGYC